MTAIPIVTIPRNALHVLARADRGNFTLWQCDVVPPSEGDWLRTECWIEVADRLKPGDLILTSCGDQPFWAMLGVAAVEKDGDKFTGVVVLDVITTLTWAEVRARAFTETNHPGAGIIPPSGSALN